jgi:hypothetical protein
MTLAQSKGMSVAVLIKASYYAYGLTYPSYLYYNAALSVLQALQYLGIPAEIVTDAITQTDLNEYGGLITVRGQGGCWALTQNYAETTGKPVMWIYVRGGDAAMNTALGITDAGQSVAGDIGLAVTASGTTGIMEGLVDDWGNLGTYTTRAFTLGVPATWTQYMVNDADSAPYLFMGEYNGGTYYIYAFAGSWMAAGGVGTYMVQLILNYAKLAMPNLIRWMPLPSGKNAALIIRADDAVDLDAKWLQFWARYPHSTSAVQASLPQSVADHIAANCDDYVPHGYAHEDFTALSYAEQVTLLEQVNDAWTERFGERPYYYIMPFNKANDDTGHAMMDTGGRFYITAVSLTGFPSTYYYRHHDNEATTWGAYYESGTLEDYVDRIVGQAKFVGSVVEHPYSGDWDATIKVHCDYLIDRVLAEPTIMLSTWSEIADLQYAKRGATITATHMGFESAVPAGMTLEWTGLQTGKTIRLGDLVLPRIGDRVILPALPAGVYPYELVDLEAYPVVTAVAAGLALKDGSYDIRAQRTTISVEGWTHDGTDPSAAVTLSTGSGYALASAAGELLVHDIGSGASVTLTPGDYIIVPGTQVSPYNVQTWMRQTAQIEPRRAFGPKGAPVYGDPFDSPALITRKMSNVLTADGNEVRSDITLTVPWYVRVMEYDRVTLADGTKRPVRAVSPIETPLGAVAARMVYL